MLMVILSVLGAVLPAVLLIVLFNGLDKKRPEPKGLIMKSVLFGFLAVLPAVIVELVLDSVIPKFGVMADAAVKGFLVAGLVEEGIKFAFVTMWIYARKEFDEVADGIVYTACLSLGFALVENVMYSVGSPWIMLARAFTAVPMHATASGIMGYFIGISKNGGGKDRKFEGLLWAVLIHGVYDFFAFSQSLLALLVIPTVVIAFIVVVKLFKKAVKIDDANPALEGTAPLAPPNP
jgi:protease PrsW